MTAPQGKVEFQGYAWPSEECVKAPLSGNLAAYYAVRIRTNWIVVGSECCAGPLYLVDGSGIALIRTADIEVDVTTKQFRFRQLTDSQQAYLLRLNERANDKDYIIEERLIPAGSPIYALGSFTTQASYGVLGMTVPAAGVREFMEKMEKHSSPAPRDRAISIATAAIQRAKENSNYQNLSVSQIRGEVHAALDEKVFVADCWQEKLLSRMGGAVMSYVTIVTGVLLLIFINVNSFTHYFDGTFVARFFVR